MNWHAWRHFILGPPAADFQLRRLYQLVGLAFIGVFLTAIPVLINAEYAAASALLVLAVFIAGLYLLLWLGLHGISAALLIGALVLGLGYQMWLGSGLRSAAALAFPGILIFAAMIGQGRLLLMTYLSQMVIISLIFFASRWGWRPANPGDMQWGHVVDYWVVITVVALAVRLLAGDLLQLLSQLQAEVKHAEQSEQLSKYLAEHDLLTGLPNRSTASELFNRLRAQSPEDTRLYMLFLDIDHFKDINNHLGHLAGDNLLRQLALGLQSELAEQDLLIRQGADEFIILRHQPRSQGLDAFIEALQNRASRLKGQTQIELRLTLSVGSAQCPQDGRDFNQLLQKADMALRQAKQEGRNRHCGYHPNLASQNQYDLQLQQALQQAIARAELRVFYQPILDLQTQQVVRVEALARWRHPQHGWVPPSRFIPLAEKSGFIHSLGSFVLSQSLQDCQSWRSKGLTSLKLSVNVSALQFGLGQLDQSVAELLSQFQVPASSLQLEITESLFMHGQNKPLAVMAALRAQGVSFAIDDFGTGYSNLSYLQRFDVSCLKIDRSFAHGVARSPANRALVQAIVQMAQSLGLSTVAEGIECPEDADVLHSMGCDQGQGYYWAKPMTNEQLLEFMRRPSVTAQASQCGGA